MACEGKCCMDTWYCESIRNKWKRKCKRCDQWQQGEVKMFKNLAIVILAVTVLIVVCNSTFTVGPVSFEMPRNNSASRIDSKLMDALVLIEQEKEEEIFRGKVKVLKASLQE